MGEKISRGPVQRLGIDTPVKFPPAGEFLEYYKADGLLYRLDSAGVELQVSSGGKFIYLVASVNKVSGVPAIVFTDIDISGDVIGTDISRAALFQIAITTTGGGANNRLLEMRFDGDAQIMPDIPSLGGEIPGGFDFNGQLLVPLSDQKCEYRINANSNTTVEIVLLAYMT